MLNNNLSFEKRNGVLTIRIFRVKNRTELVQLSSELADLCRDTLHDSDTRVILLTGADKESFLIEPETAQTESGEMEGLQASAVIAEPIAQVDLPVLAAIDGDAVGQGLELALAGDMRIASETSRFGLTQIKTGLIPWDGATQRLSRLVGTANAMELILTGEMIDAREALRIGLVNKIVSSEELMQTVSHMARQMASKAPIALRYTKEAICKGVEMTLEQGLRLEADLYLLLHTTRDRAEGIRAFLKKEVPQFKGE